jgi:hypothetical protein
MSEIQGVCCNVLLDEPISYIEAVQIGNNGPEEEDKHRECKGIDPLGKRSPPPFPPRRPALRRRGCGPEQNARYRQHGIRACCSFGGLAAASPDNGCSVHLRGCRSWPKAPPRSGATAVPDVCANAPYGVHGRGRGKPGASSLETVSSVDALNL